MTNFAKSYATEGLGIGWALLAVELGKWGVDVLAVIAGFFCLVCWVEGIAYALKARRDG